MTQATDLGAEGEGPEIRVARGRERKRVDSDGSVGAREVYDLRSEISDRRQLLEEQQLRDIVNLQHSSSPAPLHRTPTRVKDQEEENEKEELDEVDEDEDQDKYEEDEVEEEPPRRNSTDTGRRYSIRYTLEMLIQIVSMPIPFNKHSNINSNNKAIINDNKQQQTTMTTSFYSNDLVWFLGRY